MAVRNKATAKTYPPHQKKNHNIMVWRSTDYRREYHQGRACTWRKNSPEMKLTLKFARLFFNWRITSPSALSITAVCMPTHIVQTLSERRMSQRLCVLRVGGRWYPFSFFTTLVTCWGVFHRDRSSALQASQWYPGSRLYVRWTLRKTSAYIRRLQTILGGPFLFFSFFYSTWLSIHPYKV